MTYREEEIGGQMEKYVRIVGGPMFDDSGLFDGQFTGCPREIREQFVHLLMRAQFASNKLSRAQWIRDRCDNQCYNAWIQEPAANTQIYSI